MSPFNYRAGAAAGQGFQQSTNPFIQMYLDRMLKKQSAQARQSEISSAYKSLFPDLSGQDLEAMSQLGAAGVQLPKGLQDQVINGKMVKEAIAKMPAEMQQVVNDMPFDQRSEFIAKYNMDKLSKSQVDAARTELYALNKEIFEKYSDEAGLIDRAKIRRDPEGVAKYSYYNSLIDIVHPKIPGDESNTGLRNWLSTGQTTDMQKEGKSKLTPTGLTEDANRIFNGISAKAKSGVDYWDLLPEEQLFLSKQSGLEINTPEDYEEWRGVIKVGPKVMFDAAESIRSETNSLINKQRYGGGIGEIIERWAVGTLRSEGDAPLIKHLEQYYEFGRDKLKQSIVNERAKNAVQEAEKISRELNIEGDGMIAVYGWVNRAVAKSKVWLQEWDAELMRQGFTKAEIEKYFKPYFVSLTYGPQLSSGE